MAEWHHQLYRYEFEQTPGDSEGQGSLVCCRPWGHKESDTTEQQENQQKSIPIGQHQTPPTGARERLLQRRHQSQGRKLLIGGSLGLVGPL